MVLNAAVQALRQAEDLKQKVLVGIGSTPTPSDQTLTLVQLQKAYKSILLMDLDYALDKKVEQDLWNIGFKNQIETLQNNAKDKKNPKRAESQTMLSWVLQSATGFYVCLLHQICTSFKLILPFRCNIPNPVGDIDLSVSCRPPQPSSCWYICQHCLVHLGDLARYSRQPRRADSFYRQALSVSPRNGQPYNQLGLLRAARGDRLGAAYYHARGLAVGGPFPPAANNLARTLAAASSITDRSIEMEMTPVKGVMSISGLSNQISTARLSTHTYINSYIAIHHRLQSGEKLQEAEELVSGLSSTLTALVATDEFDADTIIKMCCLDLYAVYSVTDGHKLDATALTDDERRVLNLSMELVAGTLAALLLPAHTRDSQEMLPYPALPAVKVLLEWIRLHSDVLKEPSFVSRLQLWPGLCTLLNSLQESIKEFSAEDYETIPLPEDEELQGYLPIDLAFSKLKYTNCASSPLFNTNNSPNLLKSVEGLSKEEIVVNLEKESSMKKKHGRFFATEIEKLKKDKTFIDSLRAHRLIGLGTWLALYQKDSGVEYINVSDNDGVKKFTPIQNTLESNPDLIKAIEELSLLREKRLHENIEHDSKLSEASSYNREDDNLSDSEGKVGQQSGSDKSFTEQTKQKESCIPPPIVISEADFKEKVREKRAGILKPQGSLERAWGEKALSRGIRVETSSPERDISAGDYTIDAADNQDTGSSSSTVSQDGAICTDISSLLDPLTPKDKEDLSSKREGRKSRTNVAMQAIMKKQEESGKQVKFLTPVTTPEIYSNQISPLSVKDMSDKKKIIQPKAIKSLNFLPTDRKTGGILSLKDKSAGYPHLVNTETSVPSEVSKSDGSTEQIQTGLEESNNKTSPTAKPQDSKTNASGQPVAKYQSSPSKNQAVKNFDSGINLNDSLIMMNPSGYIPWSNGSPVIRPPYQGDAPQGLEDFQLNRGINMFGQSNSGNQGKPTYYTSFNMSDIHHSGITLPVVNPKEIDVRSVALQKQKTAQHIMSGDTMTPMPDHYMNHRDPNAAGHNYWYNNLTSPPGLNNPSQGTSQRENSGNSPRTNNLPPRLANLYKNKNSNQEYGVRMHDQTGPTFRYGSMQDNRNAPPLMSQQNMPSTLNKTQASWVAGSAAPHAPNTWWKPTSGEIAINPGYDSTYQQPSFNPEQHYPPNFYGQHSPSQHPRSNTDYQEQKSSPNYGQQNRSANISAGSAQMNSRFNIPFDKQLQQNVQYSSQPPNYYNSAINNFSGVFNQSQSNYGNQNSYSPIMYPQFNSKFGFPQQQQGGISKPSHIGNSDYGNNSYVSRNLDRFGAMQNNESLTSESFTDSGNQFARDLRHALPSDSSNVLSASIPEFVPKHLDLDAVGNSSKSFEGSLVNTQSDSKNIGEKDPFSFSESSSSSTPIGNTYSLFSGTPQSWGAGVPTTPAGNVVPQQSLWSGPGPSPLERLLEQQKQFKYSANE